MLVVKVSERFLVSGSRTFDSLHVHHRSAATLTAAKEACHASAKLSKEALSAVLVAASSSCTGSHSERERSQTALRWRYRWPDVVLPIHPILQRSRHSRAVHCLDDGAPVLNRRAGERVRSCLAVGVEVSDGSSGDRLCRPHPSVGQIRRRRGAGSDCWDWRRVNLLNGDMRFAKCTSHVL